jgi:hypothetical protein
VVGTRGRSKGKWRDDALRYREERGAEALQQSPEHFLNCLAALAMTVA